MTDYTTPLAFKPFLLELLRSRSKDVTRRLVKGPARWRVGAVSKVYDKSPAYGGAAHGEVLIKSVTHDELLRITAREIAREGLGRMPKAEFFALFRSIYDLRDDCNPAVWRVEFEVLRWYDKPARKPSARSPG